MNRNYSFFSLIIVLAFILLSAFIGTTLATAQSEDGSEPSGPRDSGETMSGTNVGTAFTYQGKLTDGGSPANGTYDFGFVLQDAASFGNQEGFTYAQDVEVTEGLFTVELDFGEVFDGTALWMIILVRPGDSTGGYTALAPAQALTAAPYALSLRPGAVISGTVPFGTGVLSLNSSALGLQVRSMSAGLHVNSENSSGIYVLSAGANGIEINNANNDGLSVCTTGSEFLCAPDGSNNGIEIGNAEDHGVRIDHAGSSGIYVDEAGDHGVYVNSAGDDGVFVSSAGSPSTINPSGQKNGFEVAGAEGDGLHVGRADDDGIQVTSAGDEGVYVVAAGDDGVYVQTAGGDGVVVDSASGDGVYVDSAGDDGVHVRTTVDDGVYVGWAGDDGVYANTSLANHEWGLYTPDKIYAGSTLASGGPLLFVAQNGDDGDLETGDVVVVSGRGAPFGESPAPAPLVQRASAGLRAPIFGVVYSHFVLTEKSEEIELDGQTKQSTSLHANSARGPIPPDEYLLVVVMGAAQVKVNSLSSEVSTGALLAIDTDGRATIAGTNTTFGSVVGTAMEASDAAEDGLIWVLVNPR
jgi:hypothetical protein